MVVNSLFLSTQPVNVEKRHPLLLYIDTRHTETICVLMEVVPRSHKNLTEETSTVYYVMGIFIDPISYTVQ